MDPSKYADLVDFREAYHRADREGRRRADAAEAPSREKLKALTLEELFARPQPDYLIDQWLPKGALAEMVGPPESLKSFVACHMGLLIASGNLFGKDFFGYPVVEHGPVLYIAAEGGGAFQFRVRAWCHKHKVDPRNIPFRVIPLPVNLRDPSFQAELLEVVRELKPILIVVDTLSRCAPGAEENSSRDMGEVVSFCVETQVISNAAVLFIHHPTKGDPNGAGRGSGAILGAADTEFRVVSSKGKGDLRPIKLSCTKQKDDLKPPPLFLVGYPAPVLDLKGQQIKHKTGRAVTTLLLRRGEKDEVVSDDKEVSLEERIIAFVRENPGLGKTEVKKGAAKNWHSAGAVIDRLEKEGKLTIVEVKDGKSKTQTVFIKDETEATDAD